MAHAYNTNKHILYKEKMWMNEQQHNEDFELF